MSQKPKLHSVSGLAVELGKDRRTISRIIGEKNIKPIEKKGKVEYYLMAPVARAVFNPHELNVEQEKALLAQQQTRRLERENDVAERQLIPITEVVDVLQQVAKMAASVLDAVPLNIKRRVPSLKTRDINYIKKELARARNALASAEVK